MGTRYKAVLEAPEGDIDVYLLINHYDDTHEPAEIFVTVSKQGSTLQGMMDGWATMASIALQYGVPVQMIVDKFKGQSFPPYGNYTHPEVGTCTSLLDLIARLLEFDRTAQIRR
jgi:ribonucleoside-diphosphate reductase alpha chain